MEVRAGESKVGGGEWKVDRRGWRWAEGEWMGGR